MAEGTEATTDGLTYEEVAQIVDGAVSSQVEAGNAQVGQLAQRLDGIGSDVQTLVLRSEEGSSGAEGGSETVVAIGDDQWAEMRESWLWAKQSAQVGLYLALVATLLVAAIFGSRLWDEMAKGWRR